MPYAFRCYRCCPNFRCGLSTTAILLGVTDHAVRTGVWNAGVIQRMPLGAGGSVPTADANE